jgi:hypothetical protein
VNAFRRILRGLEKSGSRVLLIFVVAMVARESKHVCEDRIQLSLKTFIQRYYHIISVNSHYSLQSTI